MAAALPFIAAGLQVAKGIQESKQASAAAKVSGQNAQASMAAAAQQDKVTAANIANEQNRLSLLRQAKQRDVSKELSSQRVRAAGSGATLGSFDSLFEDSYSDGLMDLALLDYDSRINQSQIQYEGDVRKGNYINQANNFSQEQANYKSKASSAITSSLINAGTSYASTSSSLKGN